MSESSKALMFAAIVSLVCCVMVTAASTGLKEYQNRNVVIDKQKNLLKSIALIDANRKYSHNEIETLYRESIREAWTLSDGTIVFAKPDTGETFETIYLYVKEGLIDSYILPVNSRGLWGRILGYIALKSDGATVAGFTVYSHSETPGLGGEIEKSWFQNNFAGKRIVDSRLVFVSVSISKGAAKNSVSGEKLNNYVDGISGATLTGGYLSKGLFSVLKQYEPVSVKFRKNLIGSYPNTNKKER